LFKTYRSKKKFSYSALAALMLVCALVLSACNSGGNNADKGASPSASPTGSAATQQPSDEPSGSQGATEEEVPLKYDPPIELTMVNSTVGAKIYGEGEDVNNNRWLDYIKEKYGISLKTLWAVPTDQMMQKINLMIASGDIPDIMPVTATQLAQLHKAGLIEDLTEAYAKYAPQSVKDVLNDAGPEAMASATFDGKMMALPWTGVQKEIVPVLWIREDWMKKLNLPEPKTMADVYAISEAIANGDPDENGKKDTFGLPVDKSLGNLNGFFNAHHAYQGIWLKNDNGELVYSGIQPEMKNALAKLQEMYKAGQIDKEFGVKDLGKVDENIGQNKIGMYIGGMTYSYAFQVYLPGVKWLPFPIPSIDDKPTLHQHPLNINYGYWVVKKGTKNPEALFKAIDVWLELFYQNKDDEVFKKYNEVDGVSYWVQAPIQIYKPFKNMEISVHLEPLLRSESAPTEAQLAELTPEERKIYGMIKEYEGGKTENWFYNGRNGLGGSGGIVADYVKNNHYMPDQFIGALTPTMVSKNAALSKLEIETMTKIILGSSLDEFDKFVEQWKSLGGDQITKEVNEWYKSK